MFRLCGDECTVIGLAVYLSVSGTSDFDGWEGMLADSEASKVGDKKVGDKHGLTSCRVFIMLLLCMCVGTCVQGRRKD